MYAFHHIPKCAGSTLQKRMVEHEHRGELHPGATLITYGMKGRKWEYKVADDDEYQSHESLHNDTFPRHRGTWVNPDHTAVTVVMGHAVDHTWPGQHITWIRNPYERDISHYNYDYNLGRINRTWSEWHDQMIPNWITYWLNTKYLRKPETSYSKMYNDVVQSKLIIRPMETFEKDYQQICKKLGVKPLTVRDNVQTVNHLTVDDLQQHSVEEHKMFNWYDWELYELSVRNSNQQIHP